MKEKIKLILFIIIGLLIGFIIHAIIEIPTIWLLTSNFEDFFISISWNTWLVIHFIYTIATEIIGILIALAIYKKYKTKIK